MSKTKSKKSKVYGMWTLEQFLETCRDKRLRVETCGDENFYFWNLDSELKPNYGGALVPSESFHVKRAELREYIETSDEARELFFRACFVN